MGVVRFETVGDVGVGGATLGPRSWGKAHAPGAKVRADGNGDRAGTAARKASRPPRALAFLKSRRSGADGNS